MGLDTVELVLAIEDEFGIRISNQVAQTLRAPDDVADYVMTRVRTEANRSCLTQAGFYRVRAALVAICKASRNEIRPDTTLTALLHPGIKRAWPALGSALHADNFLSLQRAPLVIAAAVVAPTLAAAAGMAWAGIAPLIVAASATFVALCANRATGGMRVVIPPNFDTVENLIPFVASSSNVLWTRDQALAKIMRITSEQLGIPIDKIRADSTFVDELGAD